MAKVKLSALVSDVRGKLNGSVFQGGPGGLSLRRQPAISHTPTARQLQMFNLVARYTRYATTLNPKTLAGFEEESQRNPRHSNFQSSYYEPKGNYFGRRRAISFGYGAQAVYSQDPTLTLPTPVINGGQFTSPYILQLFFDVPPGLPIGTQLVIDAQFSRYKTGNFNDYKWRLFGWASPTPPYQQFNLQHPFVDAYTFNARRAFVRLRLLQREYGIWSPASMAEVAVI